MTLLQQITDLKDCDLNKNRAKYQILITCQQQGRPFDYYYVKVFQRHFAIFMP